MQRRILLALGLIASAAALNAQESPSGYFLRKGVFSAGAAQESHGSTYSLRGTAGQPSTGRSDSASHRVVGGFWHAPIAAGGRIFQDGFEEN